MSPRRFSFTLPMATVKIPQPKPLREEKVYFGLTFQRDRVHNGGNGVARRAGRQEVSISSVCIKQSSDRKWGCSEPPAPTPSGILQQDYVV